MTLARTSAANGGSFFDNMIIEFSTAFVLLHTEG